MLEFELLFWIEFEPRITQRELAARLGVSLGRVNCFVRTLREAGWIKAERCNRANAKAGYAYALTEQGRSWRKSLTDHMLSRKRLELERLERQIKALTRVHRDDAGE